MEKLMDLHMRNYYSDNGGFSPGELMGQCGINGIRIIFIVNRDSVRANETRRRAVLRAGITYVSGIKINCTFRGINLHMLGYGIGNTSHDFTCIEDSIRSQAAAALSRMLCVTGEVGFGVTTEDTTGLTGKHYWRDRWIGEMLVKVLLGKGEHKEYPLLLLYRVGGTKGDNPFVNFHWGFYSQGKCCYVKMGYPQLEEVVDTIHRNGGYAILARPGINSKDHAKLLDPILEAGVDGAEAFSSYHSQE